MNNYLLVGLIIAALALFYWWQKSSLVTTRIRCDIPALPPCTIVLLADVHHKSHGPRQQGLSARIKAAQPDIILIAGDVAGKWYEHSYIDPAWVGELGQVCAALAPTVFTPGNHESKAPLYPKLAAQLRKQGVTVLEDSSTSWTAPNGQAVTIIGLTTPGWFNDDYLRLGEQADAAARLQPLLPKQGGSILIAHRPDLLPAYVGADLVVSGHAHGGQARLFGHSLYAPDQGLLPKLTAGLHQLGNTTMVISRGVGNGTPAPRLFNRPEVVVIEVNL